MIDRKNYEIYLIDYLDGNLPEPEKAELKAFLLLHPELGGLLENQKKVKLQPPSVTYPKKELLKKTAAQECPDYYAIAEAENVLSSLERRQLGKASEDPVHRARTETYRKLKVKPDFNIRYEKKDALYRKPAPGLSLWLWRSAALVILLIASGLFVRQAELPGPANIPVTINFSKISPVKKIQPEVILPLTSYAADFKLKQKKDVPQRLIRKNIDPADAPTSFIAAVKTEERSSLLSSLHTPEIALNESAKEWKSSSPKFESRDLFTSVIHTGKNLAERIKKENLH